MRAAEGDDPRAEGKELVYDEFHDTFTTGDWRGKGKGSSIPHSVQELARVKVNAGEI